MSQEVKHVQTHCRPAYQHHMIFPATNKLVKITYGKACYCVLLMLLMIVLQPPDLHPRPFSQLRKEPAGPLPVLFPSLCNAVQLASKLIAGPAD